MWSGMFGERERERERAMCERDVCAVDGIGVFFKC